MIDPIEDELGFGTLRCHACAALYRELLSCLRSAQPDQVWMAASQRLEAHYQKCDQVRRERRRRWWSARWKWLRGLFKQSDGRSAQ